MRVLHAYPEIVSKGGRPHDCRQMISYLSRRGHISCAVGVERPEDHGRIYPDDSVDVKLLKPSVLNHGRFGRLLTEFKPDIVHFSGGPRIPIQNSWARQAKRLGIPYVVSACGNLSGPTYYHRWGNKPNHFYHRWLKRLYFAAFDSGLIRDAEFVHASSETEANIAMKFGASDTQTIPFGMDDSWIRKDERSVDPYALPMTFTYLGRLSTIHKGLDLVVEAFGLLEKRGLGDQVRLILAGTSENGSLEALRLRSNELGITNVEFPGGVWAEDKEVLWNRTHYFLHMCRFNGFALATREALGQGVPIIATMESDFGDWIRDYTMGKVVDVSAESLAAQIEVLLGESANYLDFVDGVHKYRSDTTWENVAADLDMAYQEVIDGVVVPGRAESRPHRNQASLPLTGSS